MGVKSYFNMEDIKNVYVKLNHGSENGATRFMNKAKMVATKNKNYYLFKDEMALFRLFQEEVPELLARWKITCWNELVQFMD
ncbi:MAG: hypothetical protein HFJ48_06470 [Clostridia bacterium]|nr:hypothetical protein [Clostridia bacterium]